MAIRPINNINQRNYTGKDATLTVGNQDIHITNFSWDFAVDNSTSEYNNRVEGYTGYTTQTTTGSYEWTGDIVKNLNAVLRQNGVPRNNIRLMYRTPSITYRWREVKLEGFTGDNPNDDITSRTVDWKADFMRWSR